MQSFHHGFLGAKDAEIVLKKSGIDKSYLVRMVANSHGKERHIMTFLDKNKVRHFVVPFNLRLEHTFTENLEIIVDRLTKSFPGCKNPIKVDIKVEDKSMVQKIDAKILTESKLKIEICKKEEKGKGSLRVEYCYICELVGEKAGQSDHQNNHRLGLCNICDRYFGHKQISHHRKRCSNDPEYILFCHVCDYKTFNSGHLKEHIKRHNDTKPKFKCDKCIKIFKTEKRLKSHLGRHRKRVMDEYKCSFDVECAYSSRKKSNFVRHLMSHSNSKKDIPTIFTCQECPYTTKNSFNFKRHSLSCKEIRAKPIIISMIEPGTLCAINNTPD